jgi:hypothetical protein
MTEKPIVHVRLINGDEFIAELWKETKTKLQIRRPLTVSEQQDQETGNASIVLSRYLLDNGQDVIDIQKVHVITKTGIIPELETYYINSLQFNEFFIEKNVLENIKKTNSQMGMVLFNHHKAEELRKELGPQEAPRVVKIYHQCDTLQ